MKKKVYEKPTIMALALEPQRILSGSGSGGSEEEQSDQFAPITSQSLNDLEASEDSLSWRPEHYY